jgi:uncharacterized protein
MEVTMIKAIFINIAVRDLPAAMEFWKALGFGFDPRFTDDQAAALIFSDGIGAMIHTSKSLERFTAKALVDPRASTEAIFSFQLGSRGEVEDFMAKVLAYGGKQARPPEVYDFMYGRSFEDPDGHIWEVFWMDPSRLG